MVSWFAVRSSRNGFLFPLGLKFDPQKILKSDPQLRRACCRLLSLGFRCRPWPLLRMAVRSMVAVAPRSARRPRCWPMCGAPWWRWRDRRRMSGAVEAWERFLCSSRGMFSGPSFHIFPPGFQPLGFRWCWGEEPRSLAEKESFTEPLKGVFEASNGTETFQDSHCLTE